MNASRSLLVAAMAVSVGLATACGGASATSTTSESGNAPTAALAEFKERVDEYADLHKSLAKGDAKQDKASDPAMINEVKLALAERVKTARASAKQGDIFTPAARPVFRSLLAPELRGEDGRDTKAILKDDAPAPGTVPFKVNGKYPENQPIPTVPANVLLALPTLPAPLEYRIIGQHLILLDTSTDLVVDYILNAITV
jgi:hypothetical protein